jgi:hypothetical protein
LTCHRGESLLLLTELQKLLYRECWPLLLLLLLQVLVVVATALLLQGASCTAA